jgi:hypothetical protein
MLHPKSSPVSLGNIQPKYLFASIIRLFSFYLITSSQYQDYFQDIYDPFSYLKPKPPNKSQ